MGLSDNSKNFRPERITEQLESLARAPNPPLPPRPPDTGGSPTPVQPLCPSGGVCTQNYISSHVLTQTCPTLGHGGTLHPYGDRPAGALCGVGGGHARTWQAGTGGMTYPMQNINGEERAYSSAHKSLMATLIYCRDPE